jgi:hypothetical protein
VDEDKGAERIRTLRPSSMYWDHADEMIPLGNNFIIIYFSGILWTQVSLSILIWLVGYGFLISVRKRIRAVDLKYVILISAIAFISGSTITFIFG